MKNFLTRTIYFSLPFLFWLILVLLIDPYNYYSDSLFVDNNLKKETAFKLNRPLYQLLEFKNHPTKSILLGDSRTNNLAVELFKKYSGKEFSNLAYGGGSLPEIINTFWLIAKKHNLSDVYIGLNMTFYNTYRSRDRVIESEEIMRNFFSYAFSVYTFRSTNLILRNVFSGNELKIGVPDSSKEKFWKHQLEVSAKDDYGLYEYPINQVKDLIEISKYCKLHGINLIFFIPPTHIDLQNKVKEYNLQVYESMFKNDLKKIGDVYDFDFPSDITNNASNFNDPYHFSPPIGEIIVKELFSFRSGKDVIFTKCEKYN